MRHPARPRWQSHPSLRPVCRVGPPFLFQSHYQRLTRHHAGQPTRKTTKGTRLFAGQPGLAQQAARVFDSEPLREIIGELAHKALPITVGKEAEALRGLTAVDGSLLPALPKMAWALWQDDEHRAAKMHVHFDVFKGAPMDVTVTHGSGSENQQLRNMLLPKRLYVIDRGYAEYQLFQDIIDAGSSFIGRIKDNAAFEVLEERPITPEAKAAGVIRDAIMKRLGTEHHKNVLKQSVRIVIVVTGKTDSNGQPDVLILA